MISCQPPIMMKACKSPALRGDAIVPGDKSISHRAIILSALSVGESRISGLLEGEDVLATIKAVESFGAETERQDNGIWHVHGVGTGGFGEPPDVIDCGNSGTSARLLMGAMATTPIFAVFTGDASLRSRPMRRVTDPLSDTGATITARAGDRLPICIEGAEAPLPIAYTMTAPSAQVKSAILLAGLNSPGRTEIIETSFTRDHTERMLRSFGADLSAEVTPRNQIIRLEGYAELNPQQLAVPGDPSSAAFIAAAALMVEGSEIRALGVGINPTRSGFYDTIREMGADIQMQNHREEGGEPVADINVSYTMLEGIEVPPDRAPTMIDEYPILAALAATAEGDTIMRGIGELRVKESDRIDAMAQGLKACGVRVTETTDSLTVHGRGSDRVTGGATIQSRFDHRIAMSFLCLGLAAKSPISVNDGSPIATSFPQFMPLMRKLGASIEEINGG